MKIGNFEIKFFKHRSKKERINEIYDRLCRLSVLIDNEDCKINILADNLSEDIDTLSEISNKEFKRAKREEKKINKIIKSLKTENNWAKDKKIIENKIANIEKVLYEITSAIDKLSKRK